MMGVSDTESCYSVTESELVGSSYSFKKLMLYVRGKNILLIEGHKLLVLIDNHKVWMRLNRSSFYDCRKSSSTF